MEDLIMKNTIKKAAVCLLAVMLTGCMKITVTYDVAKDGNVKESIKMLVGESYLTMGGGTPEDGVQDMMESFQESNPDAVMEFASEEFDDETYYGFVGTKPESELKAVKDGNKLVLTITRDEVEEMGGAEDLTENAQSSEEVNQALKKAGFSAKIVVNMPYDAETTYGTAEGKTVTIDVLGMPDDLDEIVITCKLPNPLIPVIFGAAVLLGALYFFMNKKKAAPVPVSAEESVPAPEEDL